MIGRNCGRNMLLSSLSRTKFVRYKSLRFNLTVKYVICKSAHFMNKVPEQKKKIRTSIGVGKLRQVIELKAEVHNVTRWSSVSSILPLYCEMRGVIVELMLSGRKNKRIKETCM